MSLGNPISFRYSNSLLAAGVVAGAGGRERWTFTSSGVTSNPELPNEL